jgi:tripartite-type tricarboxylate transporter receptor subunit TctC
MKVQREWLLIILGVFILLGITCGPVQAKLNYPTKTVEMVVAYPAGGGQDVAFRILAKHAEKFMGQKIVVINKVGGGGVIGNTEIARSKPDGYTIGTIPANIASDEFTIKGLPYSHKDFIPVVMIAADPHVLVIKNSLKMDFKQFIEYVRKNPSKVSMSMGGTWNSHDFFRAKLEKAIGIKFLRTPYQGGAPALQAVAGGHINCSTPHVSEVLPSLEGKLVTPIALSNPDRAPQVPNVPTVREFGYDVIQLNWRGVTVPPGTPQEIIDYLEGVFTKAFNEPEFQNDLRQAGGFPIYRNQKDFTKYYNEEYERYKTLAKELGIEPK